VTSELKRKKIEEEKEPEIKKQEVTAGAIDKALDLAFNPSREKIREVTIIDRVQGRLFPILDLINAGQQYILEVAKYRESKEEYLKLFKRAKPLSPNFLDDLMYRTAQWQKSVAGTNLTKITDIALAEMETKSDDIEGRFHADSWGSGD